MSVVGRDATTASPDNLPKGKGSAQDGLRKVPERWQNTERASRLWREVDAETDKASRKDGAK